MSIQIRIQSVPFLFQLAALLAGPGFSDTSAFAGGLVGLETIQSDLIADAASGFNNVKLKEWELVYQGTECMNVELSPMGAFQVTRPQTDVNIFRVRLLDSRDLLTPFNEVVSIQAQTLGCSVGEVLPSDEVGVEFRTNTGAPLSLVALRSDRNVSDLSLNAVPANVVTQTRIEGGQVFYRRARGQGTVPVVVTLFFKYKGIPYTYRADLPLKDDGYVWSTLELRDRIRISSDYLDFWGEVNLYYPTSITDAYAQLAGAVRGRYIRACEERVENWWMTGKACGELARKRGFNDGEFEVIGNQPPECEGRHVQELYVASDSSCRSTYRYSTRTTEYQCYLHGIPESGRGRMITNEGTCTLKVLQKR